MSNIIRSEIRAELVRRELAIRRFHPFLRYRFLQERREFSDNWHLHLICEVMEAVYRRDERRVLVNMPFRSLKTETLEQSFQAWMILQEDSSRSSVLSAAADYTLAEESSAKTLEIVSSQWFQNLAGRPVIPPGKRPARDDWTTVGGARRQAMGIGGQVTGKGADHLIWGDILKPEDANSDRKRTRACTWLGETFRSRLNNQKTGTITGIMQRLHELDPTGYLLERMKAYGADKWLLIKIEMESPRSRVYAFNDFFYERKAGELLHPARIGPKEVAALKVDLGNNYSGQCNQNPIKMKGSYYQLDWFHYYDETPILSHVYQVWDYALTEEAEEKGDYSVCITFGLTKSGQLYILDVYRQRIGSIDVVEQTMAHAIRDKAIAVFGAKGPIDKAIRPWITKRMEETGVFFRLEGLAETTDIVARSTPFQSMVRNGNVYLPSTARWLADFKLEFSAFPKGAHDDICAAAAIIGMAMPEIRAGEILPGERPKLRTPEERAEIDRNLITGIAIRKAVGKVAIPDHNLAKSEPVRFAVERVRAGLMVTRITSEDYHLAVRDALIRLVKSEADAGRGKIAAMATGELGRLDRRFTAGRFALAATPAGGENESSDAE